ncbi:MAG: polymer-forming cytoskeletal protein [Daejeonella sp.]|uniref:bactofilin family protein n=1 Tax=Daejeonella sp. TaxID=2805397 RepID=UPI002732852B|nr:polymer-forming cytoskeletal protein [Daejeonella sp.]MDP3469691.1 polymer-forming cytoskeletal protein [Daejeonella sp.]
MIGRAVNFIKKYLDKKDRQKEIIADFHTTIIRVEDNFISSTSVMLDERLIGNIYSLKEVTVASGAEISGNITSRTSNIHGKVIGDIISTESAIIRSSAIICGNIRAKSINVEPGCTINGMIRIEGNIDERDLIEKVENRLPPKSQKEIISLPYLISEPAETEMEAVAKPTSQHDRPSEVNKRAPVPVTKTKLVVPSADQEEANKPNTNSWY